MAVSQGIFGASPILQIISLLAFFCEMLRPRAKPFPKAFKFIETPRGKTEQSTRFYALCQIPYESFAPLCAWQMMNHPEKHDQIIFAIRQRLIHNIRLFQFGLEI